MFMTRVSASLALLFFPAVSIAADTTSPNDIDWFGALLLAILGLLLISRLSRPLARKYIPPSDSTPNHQEKTSKRYASKTCYQCGIILPANQMYRCEVETAQLDGKSRKSVTPLTMVGALLGNKKSSGAMESWFFGTSSRKSKSKFRSKSVWLCGACAGKTSAVLSETFTDLVNLAKLLSKFVRKLFNR